jgi:hypothetical protein
MEMDPHDANALASAEAFLRSRDLTTNDLLSAVGGFEQHEAGLIIGSVASGYANSLSDLDVMIVGERRGLGPNGVSTSQNYRSVYYRLPSSQKLNVRLYSPSVVDSLGNKMERSKTFRENPAQGADMPVLSEWEYIFLHELRAGAPLSPVVAQVRASVRAEDLPLHGMMRHVVDHYAAREDAIGQTQEGDRRSALWMLRASMTSLAQAVLASVGVTEYRRKWLWRNLERHRSAIGDPQMQMFSELLCDWPAGDLAAILEKACAFADQEVAAAFQRKPQLLPLMGFFSSRTPTVTSIAQARAAS